MVSPIAGILDSDAKSIPFASEVAIIGKVVGARSPIAAPGEFGELHYAGGCWNESG